MTNNVEEAEQPEVITATFADEASARAGLDALREAQKAMQILLADLALVVRDGNNLEVREPDDMTAPEGASYGGLIGGIVGLIAGPLGLVVGGALGALIGGAAAQTSDSDIEDEWLRDLGASLTPGGGMVVAVTPAIHAPQVAALLTSLGGKALTRTLDSDLAYQMEIEEVVGEDV